ncbi:MULTISPECIES: DUF6101 family protein [unclassified Aureimonas]|uniref:DUF6101 family protein n=1 Tax=unclassified Aureimonas TaxID=2615206 RepID=UPI0007217BA0|nr:MULTISPECIES: DUF6101 family protein [unclassified Aureimonas]ALN72961.1 hypothetical protein M673_09550 [Aureimonas sp. AU20]
MSLVTNPTSLKPEWASMPIRLDPALAGRKQTFEVREGEETITYRVDRRGAVIRRKLEMSGIPVAIALAPRSFKGVAARAMEDGEGEVTVTLELHHENPKLSVPLLVACDLYDVAADWRSWSELFDLPMLMVESDGRVTALEETFGKLRTGEPATRRRSSHRGRRPRFLARRKPGGLGMRMVVAGEEIIARN